MIRVPLASPPPADPAKFLPHLEILPGFEEIALCLTEEVLPINTHYIDGKTRPCFGHPDLCPGCADNLDKRWLGYLAVWPRYKHSAHLVWITWTGWGKSKQLQAHDGNLRGRQLRLTRAGKTKNSPLLVQVEAAEGTLANLKPVPRVDLAGALAKMWKLEGIEFVQSVVPQDADLFTGKGKGE